jgi:hypothetical protein
VIILIYFVASVFIVAGFMLLFAYHRTRRKELLLLAFIYSASGLAAGYSLKWWILIAGFVVVWLLKFAGYDPDKLPKGNRTSGAPGEDSGTNKG